MEANTGDYYKMDIVDKIRKKAPSEIDIFHADMQRRDFLTDKNLTDILSNVFATIDPDTLKSTEIEYQYQNIAKNLSV